MNVVVFMHSRKHFGAQLVHIPALFQIRKMHPNARIIALTKFDHTLALKELGFVDEVFVGDGFSFNQNVIRTHQCTIGYSFRPTSYSPELVMMLSGVKQRVAFKKLLSDGKVYSKERYRAREFFDMLRCDEDYHEVCAQIRQHVLTGLPHDADHRAPALVFVPGAGGKEKRWPLERFIELAKRAEQTLDQKPLFILGPEEHEEKAILEQESSCDLIVSPDLKTLCRIIAGSQMVVSGDCGPAHIAHITASRQIVMFIETLVEWFDFRDNSLAIAGDDGIQDIDVDTIFQHLQSLGLQADVKSDGVVKH